MLQNTGPGGAGELAALICVEDLWTAIPFDGFFQSFDAERGVLRVGQPPSQTFRECQSMMATTYRKP